MGTDEEGFHEISIGNCCYLVSHLPVHHRSAAASRSNHEPVLRQQRGTNQHTSLGFLVIIFHLQRSLKTDIQWVYGFEALRTNRISY